MDLSRTIMPWPYKNDVSCKSNKICDKYILQVGNTDLMLCKAYLGRE